MLVWWRIFHKYSSTNRRCRYAQQPLHREPFMRTCSYTESFVHKRIFTHRSLYTQRFSRKRTFTHRNFTHRCFTQTCFCCLRGIYAQTPYTQTLLHTDTFTNKNFYTETFAQNKNYTKTCSSPLHQTVCFFCFLSFPFQITNLYGLYFSFSFGSSWATFHGMTAMLDPCWIFCWGPATLRTAAFTQSSFYKHIPLHGEVCAQIFLLHKITQRRLYTHKWFYAKRLLRTDRCS